MKIEHLPYVNAYADRHGRMRYYYRRKGYPRVALPGSPGTPEFQAAWVEAGKRQEPVAEPDNIAPGSFNALVREYEQSAEFKQLADSTKRETGYVLAKLVQRHGPNPVDQIRTKHIRKYRDELKDKPGAANKMLRVLKVLLSFAEEREYIARNPAQRVKLMRLGEHRAWTKAELTVFEKRWALGTLERLGYALSLYTGQRRADVAALRWDQLAGDALKLKQQKTDTILVIPLANELKVALAAVHPRAETILAKNGKPLSPIYFGHMMAEAIDAAGLDRKCVLHGLRKSAAVALIDAGCTPHQAMAITGHKTAQMLELYARGRNQEKLARDAMRKRERAKR